MSTAGRLDIAIVGYGTGGQAAAVFLSRDGHNVQVFERAPSPRPIGAGFLLQPTGLEALWSLGLLERALAYGAPVERLYGETIGGRPVMDMRYRELDPRLFGLGLQRGTLFSLLDRAWTPAVQAGCSVAAVDTDRGTLTDARGRRYGPFDLVVVADGAASQLRGQVAPAHLDRPYPWGAQWCLVEAGAWAWPAELRQRYRQARAMAGMLPVGTHPDDPTPRASFFWSVPTAELEPSAWCGEPAWRAGLDAVWPEAAQALGATCVPEGLAAARYRDAVHSRWHAGRAVLLGDAAHAMSPQLGQGVNMALLDARALRDALREAPPAQALPRYVQRRRAHVRAYQAWSRWLTPLFQSERDLVAHVRDWGFHPLTRIPGLRNQSLRVLTGTRYGWFGALQPDAAFLEALDAARTRGQGWRPARSAAALAETPPG
ncbi:FAD-dependent oxidoreductase [Luteimonas abyssi]|uniref:FAD-dependent oxidoreductase n=1 Tax=Luteimonas abyssi TaxID=1247514 RepID=UPI0009E76982|nr:NAD(P)/FAD-dependent oxidoreductase [Luteimonas abyssi]